MIQFLAEIDDLGPILEITSRFGMAGAACWFLLKDRERLVASLKQEQQAHIDSLRDGYEKRIEWLEKAHQRYAMERDEMQKSLNEIHRQMLSHRNSGGCGVECMNPKNP